LLRLLQFLWFVATLLWFVERTEFGSLFY